MKIAISNISLKKTLPISIVIAGLLIAGSLLYINQTKNKNQGTMQVLSANDAANKAIDFVNQSLSAEGATSTATLNSVSEGSGVYTISFTIDDYPYTAYVSEDGRYIFPDSYDMTVSPSASAPSDNGASAPSTPSDSVSPATSSATAGQ